MRKRRRLGLGMTASYLPTIVRIYGRGRVPVLDHGSWLHNMRSAQQPQLKHVSEGAPMLIRLADARSAHKEDDACRGSVLAGRRRTRGRRGKAEQEILAPPRAACQDAGSLILDRSGVLLGVDRASDQTRRPHPQGKDMVSQSALPCVVPKV